MHRWKTELEHVILEMTKEIELLEAERRRVKQSLSVFTIPESIAGEFLQLRSKRLESDLIRDEVEEELTKVNISGIDNVMPVSIYALIVGGSALLGGARPACQNSGADRDAAGRTESRESQDGGRLD